MYFDWRVMSGANSMKLVLNGLNVGKLRGMRDTIDEDGKKGMSRWGVVTEWRGALSNETTSSTFELGGKKTSKDIKLVVDEPRDFGGANSGANPVDYLLTGLNACLMAGYTVTASLMGIELESLEIASSGEIDLRHWLEIDARDVRAGMYDIVYTVYIKGDGTQSQFEELHEKVRRTSPIRNLMANSISIDQIVVL